MKNMNMNIQIKTGIGWQMLVLIICGLPSCVNDFEKEIHSINPPRLFKPLTVSIGTVSSGSVELSWQAAATAFEVEYSLSPDFTADVAVRTVTQSPCIIDQLEEMTVYYFRIRGISGSERPAPSDYSDTVSAATSAGTPIDNVTAVAEINYTTDPVVVTTTVSVTWGSDNVEPEAITTVTFTAGSNTPLEYPVSPEEAAAQHKTVNTGLEAATTYIVRIYRGAKLRGSCTVTTPDMPLLPSDNMTVITPDMGDLRDIILDPSRKDTLYLQAGAYNLTSTDNTTALTANLVLISRDPAATVVTLAKPFNPEGTFDRIVFKNITFHCATYLMQQKIGAADKQFAVDEYRIENCIIDLSSTQTTNSTLLSVEARTAGFTGRINKCIFENVTAYSYAGNAQGNFIQISANDLYMSVGEIKLKNCTSTNTARGIIVLGQVSEPVSIDLENCTFYNINKGNNYVIYAAKTTDATINISKSIFHFGGTGYRLVEFTTGSRVTVGNTYYFKGQGMMFNNKTATAAGITGLPVEYNGTPADLFVNPNDNPTAPGASFKIKDLSLSGIGDLRWQ
jgi:hypothetical protein